MRKKNVQSRPTRAPEILSARPKQVLWFSPSSTFYASINVAIIVGAGGTGWEGIVRVFFFHHRSGCYQTWCGRFFDRKQLRVPNSNYNSIDSRFWVFFLGWLIRSQKRHSMSFAVIAVSLRTIVLQRERTFAGRFITYLFAENGNIFAEGIWWAYIASGDAWFAGCACREFTFLEY